MAWTTRAATAVAAGSSVCQGLLDPIVEQRAVGQARQPVVERLVLQFADHGGKLPVEPLVVEHGEQLPAEHEHHQHREAPVQEGPCRTATPSATRYRPVSPVSHAIEDSSAGCASG
jgi:hypothetical protein